MAEANAPPNDGEENVRIAAISLKLPPFWTADPLVWFAQIESQFATRGITSQCTKYDYVVASLNQDIAMEVQDILISPPADQPFSTLKDKLLLRTTASEQRRLQTLLTTRVVTIHRCIAILGPTIRVLYRDLSIAIHIT